MQPKIYKKNSWIAKLVEFLPFFLDEYKYGRSEAKYLKDTCEVRAALIKTGWLILFEFWVLFNIALLVIGTVGDTIMMFNNQTPYLFAGPGEGVGVAASIVSGMNDAIGTQGFSRVPIMAFGAVGTILSILALLLIPVIVIIIGVSTLVEAYQERKYAKYCQLCVDLGLEPLTKYELKYQGRDWRFQSHKNQSSKFVNFFEDVYDLIEGWAQKFCKPVKWE